MGKHRRGRLHRHKPRRVKSRRALFLSAVGLGIAAAGIGSYYALSRPLDAGSRDNQPKKIVIKNPVVSPAERTTFLLLGTDTRPGESVGNSDVILVCSVDDKNRRIELMSIPRDTKVMFPGGSFGKINEGLRIGGPVMMENLVETLLHVPIDHYAVTHFRGLVQIIDTIGGITVNVPKRMYYNTGDTQWNLINLRPGLQTLNGAQALGFVRFRHDALGDVGRTIRQQQFLAALAQQLFQPENITKLPTLVRQCWSAVETDMSLLDITSMAAQAKKYQSYSIVHETLPGAFHDPTGPRDQSYWIVNPEQAKYVAKQFFLHGIVQSNPIQMENETLNWFPPESKTLVNPAGTPTKPGARVSNQNSGQHGTGTSHVQSPTGTATPPRWAKVVGRYANLRSGAGMDFDVVGSVVRGQSVLILSREGDWDYVKTDDGRIGYIANWLVSAADRQPGSP
jgi:polyisoprenyl-teichoic acid--peptidoglycan teichoic acid transferase